MINLRTIYKNIYWISFCQTTKVLRKFTNNAQLTDHEVLKKCFGIYNTFIYSVLHYNFFLRNIYQYFKGIAIFLVSTPQFYPRKSLFSKEISSSYHISDFIFTFLSQYITKKSVNPSNIF